MEDSQNEALETVRNEKKVIKTTPMELNNLKTEQWCISIFHF